MKPTGFTSRDRVLNPLNAGQTALSLATAFSDTPHNQTGSHSKLAKSACNTGLFINVEFQSVSGGPLAFVMAHRNTTGSVELTLLKRVISQLFGQTDSHWKLIIVDDQSTYRPAIDYIENLQHLYPDKVCVLRLNDQAGPGMARNKGVLIAAKNACPVIMYCDSDDLVHRERVSRTRTVFQSTQTPTVMYSGFVAVDSNGFALNRSEITPSLLEILDAIAHDPPTGMDVWKHIGTRSGYINLTSATSVSTSTALLRQKPSQKIHIPGCATLRLVPNTSLTQAFR